MNNIILYESKIRYAEYIISIHQVPRHYICFYKYYFDYNESDCMNVVNFLLAERVE